MAVDVADRAGDGVVGVRGWDMEAQDSKETQCSAFRLLGLHWWRLTLVKGAHAGDVMPFAMVEHRRERKGRWADQTCGMWCRTCGTSDWNKTAGTVRICTCKKTKKAMRLAISAVRFSIAGCVVARWSDAYGEIAGRIWHRARADGAAAGACCLLRSTRVSTRTVRRSLLCVWLSTNCGTVPVRFAEVSQAYAVWRPSVARARLSHGGSPLSLRSAAPDLCTAPYVTLRILRWNLSFACLIACNQSNSVSESFPV